MTNEVDFSSQLLKLSENFRLDSTVNEEVFEKLEQFYSYKERHEYSKISQIVFNLEDEKNEYLEFNLLSLIEQAENKNSSHMKKYNKLYDHFRLSLTQKQFIERHLQQLRNEHSEAQRQIMEAFYNTSASLQEIEYKSTVQAEIMEEQSRQLKNLEKRSKKITSDFVSILGIFSAVIFAAFGGLEILKNILGNIELVQTGKLLLFSSLTIGGIVSLVFLLLNGLSKLTGLKLRSCDCESDMVCTCNVVQKHPTLVIVYQVLLFVALIGVTEYFIDYTAIFNEIINSWGALVQLFIVLGFSIIFIVSSVIWFRYKKNSSCWLIRWIKSINSKRNN